MRLILIATAIASFLTFGFYNGIGEWSGEVFAMSIIPWLIVVRCIFITRRRNAEVARQYAANRPNPGWTREDIRRDGQEIMKDRAARRAGL